VIDANDSGWQSFLDAAKDYTDRIDTDAGNDLVETCADLHRSLLELQLAALDLPETTFDGDDPAMVTEAKRADREKVRARFDMRYRMPEQVLYIPPRAEPCDIRDLSDDLCDLYDALQDIIALNDQGYLDAALWQARGGYVEDWGYLVVSAQAVLWKYVAEAMIDAEEVSSPEP
jgi:predicted trehalose synthase